MVRPRWMAPAGGLRRLCLPPGQRVLTAEGYRPVAEIDARDAVVTAAGRLRLVTKVFCRDAAEPLYRARTLAGHVLRATGSHPVLARRREGPARWSSAASLRAGDLVAVHGRAVEPDTPWTAHARSLRPPLVDEPDAGKAPELRRGSAHAGAATLAREDAAAYWPVDWVAVEAVAATPYAGLVYGLEVEEDHCYVTDGLVVGDCTVGPSDD